MMPIAILAAVIAFVTTELLPDRPALPPASHAETTAAH